MQYQCGANVLELVSGDICTQRVDAIVNAANEQLAAGGGVCGAIHYAAGTELADACRQIGHCPTGEARITPGFKLKARYVIHAVGPRWRSLSGDAQQLASAYHNTLQVARDHGVTSVAFPSISTGIFGYPLDEAATIAIRTVSHFLEGQSQITLARFVFLNEETFTAYRYAARRLLASTSIAGR